MAKSTSVLKYLKSVNKEVEKNMNKASKTPKAPKAPAHLAKVEKFAAQLPSVSDDAAQVLSTLSGLSTTDINTVIAHATAEVRRRSVLASATTKVAVGDRVRIVSHQDGRYIGKVGTVGQVQRIRAYVDVDGGREVYCFTSDLAPVTDEVVETVRHEPTAETLEEAASTGEYLTIEEETTEETDEAANA
jgi:hypothetical protein